MRDQNVPRTNELCSNAASSNNNPTAFVAGSSSAVLFSWFLGGRPETATAVHRAIHTHALPMMSPSFTSFTQIQEDRPLPADSTVFSLERRRWTTRGSQAYYYTTTCVNSAAYYDCVLSPGFLFLFLAPRIVVRVANEVYSSRACLF